MVSENFFHDLYENILHTPSQDVFLFFVGKSIARKEIKPGKKFDPRPLEQFFKSMSIGSLKLQSSNLKEKEFIFKLDNSAFKTKMRKPTCYVACGIAAGFFEHSFGKYAGAKEHKCISKGDPHCEIKVKVFNGI